MSEPTEDDWRLQGQEQYLQGVELIHTVYSAPSATWDHDHCEFCFAKFMEVDKPDIHRAGYKTVVNDHWICDPCFNDFKSRFQWTVKP